MRVALKVGAQTVGQLVDPSKRITAELTTPEKVKKPSAYKRLQNASEKSTFRTQLLDVLYNSWANLYGEGEATALQRQFIQMAEEMSKTGAVIFADLIDRSSFGSLVQAYDQILEHHGNQSWLHSYVNLANHPKYLTDERFSNAFLHPLLVALIAYQVGGAVRIVDARAKNAEPLSVKAQDNMLHIDNTPFNDEFKVIVTWERSKASGPKGQSFVFIPGTHHGVRQCLVDGKGAAWSTENGSIFVTPETVQNVFDVQQQALSVDKPTVIEVKHDEKPLTTVFSAGSLVHHRYRTEKGYARSCMIVAFHRAKDNPGQFMAPEHVGAVKKDELTGLLFGHQDGDDSFFAALVQHGKVLADKMIEISAYPGGTEVILQKNRELTTEELAQWKEVVTVAPTVEDKKSQDVFYPIGREMPRYFLHAFIGSRMMMYDKHGPLDLILYENAHEEIRKWARNRIREMHKAQLRQRLVFWTRTLTPLAEKDILMPLVIKEMASNLVTHIDSLTEHKKQQGKLASIETISPQDAYRSLRQLIIDLGEAIGRCDTLQAFVSTSLFLFWAVDELKALEGGIASHLKEEGAKLLQHYVSSAILLEQNRERCLPNSTCAMRIFSQQQTIAFAQGERTENGEAVLGAL